MFNVAPFATVRVPPEDALFAVKVLRLSVLVPLTERPPPMETLATKVALTEPFNVKLPPSDVVPVCKVLVLPPERVRFW